MTGQTKLCRVCGEHKAISGFSRGSGNPDGLQYRCKDCRSVYYQANKEHILEIGRKYKMENRENRNAKQKDYYQANKEYQREWRRKYREEGRAREQWLKRNYGISREDYSAMLMLQGYLCPVCGVDLRTLAPKNVHVDHDHQVREEGGAVRVRAILCANCNLLLGHAKDDPDILRSAIVYLEWTWESVREMALELME